jgi:hypothetical protein
VTVGRFTTTISTMAQLAAAVGAPTPPGPPVAQAAGDTIALLEAWVAHLRALDWEFLSAPTPSRERTLRELTVNVFAPLDLLPGAWESGELPWHPEDDAERGAAFGAADSLADWAAGVSTRWAQFVSTNEAALDDEWRVLSSPRGRLEWGPLVSSQRWHAAFHYRQLVEFARLRGVARPPGVLELETLELELPEEVF